MPNNNYYGSDEGNYDANNDSYANTDSRKFANTNNNNGTSHDASAPPTVVDRNVRKPWNEVRYGEMDAKTKAEVRKQEREFKKDRDRTMGYFNSVSKAIADVTASFQDGSMDAQGVQAAYSAIADGFLTELQKKLKSDVTIFRNASACRVMEAVVTKADLTQTKTFMYILLGKVGDLMHSPTASFVFETVLAGLYRNLGLLNDVNGGGEGEGGGDDMLKEKEAAEAGAAGHGLPKSTDLLASWVEEACECMESLIVDVPGSRSLRTLLMMLSGRPIRGVAPPKNPPQFPDLLATVADSAMAAIESVYTGAAQQQQQQEEEYNNNPYAATANKKKGTVSVSEAWLKACCANTTGAVVQALLQVDADDVLPTKLSRMYLKGSSVMDLLLDSITGARVVQSLLRSTNTIYGHHSSNNNTNNNSDDANADDGGAEEEEAAAAVARWERVLAMVLNHPKLDEVIATPKAVMEKLSFDHPEASNAAAEAVATSTTEGNNGDSASGQLTSSSHTAAVPTPENPNADGYASRRNLPTPENPNADGYASRRNKESGYKRNRRGGGDRGSEYAEDPREAAATAEAEAEAAGSNNSGLNATVSPLFFLVQDLVTFCPDSTRLQQLWDDLLSPRLPALVSSPDFGPILTRLTRKCAFHGINSLTSEAISYGGGAEGSTNNNANNTNAPTNHIQQGQLEEPNVRADIRNGAPYFAVPLALREAVVNDICRCLKQRCTKGAAQALLVERALGDVHSAAVAYNILSMGPRASAHFFNAVDKLKVDDLVASALTAQGACVFQRFILTAAAKDALAPSSSSSAPNANANANANASKTANAKLAASPSAAVPAVATTTTAAAAIATAKRDNGSLIRFIRRISPHLTALAANKYAGYVVECAYEQTSVEGKEELVKGLSELHQSLLNEDNSLRTERNKGNVGFGAVHSLDPVSRSIAKKVMLRCCVEQYVHRKPDWLKLAERQSNVKRMMMQILANDKL